MEEAARLQAVVKKLTEWRSKIKKRSVALLCERVVQKSVQPGFRHPILLMDPKSFQDIYTIISCKAFLEDDEEQFLGDLHFLTLGIFKDGNDAFLLEIEKQVMDEHGIEYAKFVADPAVDGHKRCSKGWVYEIAKSEIATFQKRCRDHSLKARNVAVMGKKKQLSAEKHSFECVTFPARDDIRPASQGFVIRPLADAPTRKQLAKAALRSAVERCKKQGLSADEINQEMVIDLTGDNDATSAVQETSAATHEARRNEQEMFSPFSEEEEDELRKCTLTHLLSSASEPVPTDDLFDGGEAASESADAVNGGASETAATGSNTDAVSETAAAATAAPGNTEATTVSEEAPIADATTTASEEAPIADATEEAPIADATTDTTASEASEATATSDPVTGAYSRLARPPVLQLFSLSILFLFLAQSDRHMEGGYHTCC